MRRVLHFNNGRRTVILGFFGATFVRPGQDPARRTQRLSVEGERPAQVQWLIDAVR